MVSKITYFSTSLTSSSYPKENIRSASSITNISNEFFNDNEFALRWARALAGVDTTTSGLSTKIAFWTDMSV